MFKKNKIAIPLVALFLIGIVVYRVWISFSVFAFGDWAFAFSETLRDYIFPSSWGIHGGALLWKYPLLLFYSVFGHLGLDFNVAEKFTILWPIIFIAPLSSFLLVKKITGSKVAGFVGSLVFTYNTYFLSIDTQGHELLTVAFAIAPFALIAFINLLESKKVLFIPITAIILFVVGFYDLRSLYVLAGVTAIYAIYHQFVVEENFAKSFKTNFINSLLVLISFFLLSLYWLIPVISMRVLTTNEFLIRQLFGGSFYNIQNALTLFYPFWTGSEPTWFYVQKIPFSFWLYPVLAFVGLIAGRKNKKAAFFGILALLGVFLTKQEAPPFPNIYSWLYVHIPGFAAFREASKFYFLIALSYSVLIGFFVVFVEKLFNKNKRAKYLVLLLLIIFPLWNTKPLLTGQIKTAFISKTVPSDFIELKDYIVKDKNYSRVIGINLNMYYNFTTNNHPTLDLLYSLRNFWGGDLITYDFEDKRTTQGKKIIDYVNSDEGKRLLSASSVGYVFVPIQEKQTNNNIRRDLGKNRKYFEESLAKVEYLEEIEIGLKDILLFKNKEYKPHIYLTKEKESLKKDVPFEEVDFISSSPTEQRFKISSLSSPTYLHFTELYHPDWKVRIGDFKWYEVFFKKNYFLPEKFQSQNVARFNSYMIDPKFVKENFSYIKNDDGSIDLDMTVYFKPQSYLYLGLIISGGTLFSLIFVAVYLYKKRK